MVYHEEFDPRVDYGFKNLLTEQGAADFLAAVRCELRRPLMLEIRTLLSSTQELIAERSPGRPSSTDWWDRACVIEDRLQQFDLRLIRRCEALLEESDNFSEREIVGEHAASDTKPCLIA